MHRFVYHWSARCSSRILSAGSNRSQYVSNSFKLRVGFLRAFSSKESDQESVAPLPESPFPSNKWSWIPPRKVTEETSSDSGDEDIIPVKKG